MTAYTQARNAFARQPQWLVEIDLDRCTRVFGASPCAAVDNGDGKRCYYTFGTCQDAPNFQRTTRTWRFCLASAPWPDPAVQVWPLLDKVAETGQQIDAEKLVTIPGKIDLNFSAHWNPAPFDHDKGTCNSGRGGEFWRVLLARNRNYPGRKLRLYRGFVAPGITLADFVQVGPEYGIKQIQITEDGCKITAESPLAKLNDRQTPWSISEKNTLQAAMTDTSTTLQVKDCTEYPDPATLTRNKVFLKVENEIVQASSLTASTNTFTVVRGQCGTTAVAHAITDTGGKPIDVKVTHVAVIGQADGKTGIRVADALLSLLEWAGIQSSQIATSTFDALTDQFWSTPEVYWLLTKPTKIAKLAAKIREPRGILLFLDKTGKFAARIMGPSTEMFLLGDDQFIEEPEVDEDEESRITRASIWYDPIKEGSSNPADYNKAMVYVDKELERPENYGEPKEDLITDPGFASSLDPLRAANLARRLITRRRAGVRTVSFVVDVRDSDPTTGDAVLIVSQSIQGPDGTPEPRPCIITGKRESGGRDPSTKVKFRAVDTNFGGKFLRIAPNTATRTYDEATDEERLQYGFWGNDDNRVGAEKILGWMVW